MQLSENDRIKWYNYFRYFYFHETMTFEDFLNFLASGYIPRRKKVDWSRVVGAYEVEK